MSRSLLHNLAALLALLPAALVHLRGGGRRDVVYWAVLAVAAAGATSWAATLLAGAWRTGLTEALWVSIAVSLVVFMIVSLVSTAAARLTPLLLPYLLVLGIIATVWAQAPERTLPAETPPTWLGVHIVVSLLTYALLTIAAVAGVAVLVHRNGRSSANAGAR